MLWVLFEGTKLPGGTVISDKGTCFNKTRTNKHFFYPQKKIMISYVVGLCEENPVLFFKEASGWSFS